MKEQTTELIQQTPSAKLFAQFMSIKRDDDYLTRITVNFPRISVNNIHVKQVQEKHS